VFLHHFILKKNCFSSPLAASISPAVDADVADAVCVIFATMRKSTHKMF
jgi:hypothetical protein